MRVDPDVLDLIFVFFASMWGFGFGYVTRGYKTRKEIAQAEERMATGVDARMEAILGEIRELRAHVADITLAIADSPARVVKGDDE
ncbi:hypothetical protein HN371_20605 [Candidatus Poribacteria bacterium]|nr:hypothetical protein [Candidatus Poribacteria bacterium]MBT5534510.1 hypothetical protein [Candidatus Poribacteria bacterium]MBT5714432.1 hypothetical protein [Candidatus Poribacteria bacterium]MBT7101821.1 hypothetical protein [Candidatus Poribacteria bacterium]MBT7807557.1 hypothetical protein [Candidatus Poribacteria bacterium]